MWLHCLLHVHRSTLKVGQVRGGCPSASGVQREHRETGVNNRAAAQTPEHSTAETGVKPILCHAIGYRLLQAFHFYLESLRNVCKSLTISIGNSASNRSRVYHSNPLREQEHGYLDMYQDKVLCRWLAKTGTPQTPKRSTGATGFVMKRVFFECNSGYR